MDEYELDDIYLNPFTKSFSIKCPAGTNWAIKTVSIMNVYNIICNKNKELFKSKLIEEYENYYKLGMDKEIIETNINDIMNNL